MAVDLVFEIVEGEQALGLSNEILGLGHVLFPDFTDGYLLDRLPTVSGLALVAAHDPDGMLLGFKLGYARCDDTFYSWLGGIHPSIRRMGVARQLMQRQHDWARDRGYAAVETRTRTVNNAMIILNLQSGFQIVGYEVDESGHGIVTQRATLKPQS